MFSLLGDFFFLMFPFTYFHLLVLCLPAGQLIFTLQDSESIKAKPPGGSRTQYIGFFCSILYVDMWAVCPGLGGKELLKSLNSQRDGNFQVSGSSPRPPSSSPSSSLLCQRLCSLVPLIP